jgi:hypothetical protein
LNKLGYQITPNQYLFLVRGDQREDVYSYVEKVAGVSKEVSKAIDKGESFSAEYLKELDYDVPKGYELKGDLCCPVEKKAEEPLAPNLFKLSNGTVIDLDNISWQFRGPRTDIDYNEYYTPKQFTTTLGARPPSDLPSAHYIAKGPNKEDIPFFQSVTRDGTIFETVPGSAQTKHTIKYFYDPKQPKPNLPENLAEQFVEAFGRDEFEKVLRASIKQPDHSYDAVRSYIKKGLNDRLRIMGANVDTPAHPNPIKPHYDHYEELARAAEKPKPTLVQKIKPYRKVIGAGAGLTGLGTLAYYLYNKNKNVEKTEQSFQQKKANALIVSGLHGDEPAGDIAADKLKDSVDVVSHINPSNKRRFEGKDLNRHFNKPTEGNKQKTILDLIKKKKPDLVVSLHEDDEAKKPYAYASKNIKDKVEKALKDKDTAKSAHGDKAEHGVISEGKNPPDGSLEKALDAQGIHRVTLETPSKTENKQSRVKTHLDVVRKLLSKKAAADHPLKSTNIKAVGYDKKDKTLEVEFHSGGTYKYNNVPKSLFDRIKKVKSPGKFFHKHIRRENKYEYNKLNEKE